MEKKKKTMTERESAKASRQATPTSQRKKKKKRAKWNNVGKNITNPTKKNKMFQNRGTEHSNEKAASNLAWVQGEQESRTVGKQSDQQPPERRGHDHHQGGCQGPHWL